MKRRLCIGIQKSAASWDAVLNNLGVFYEEVDYQKSLIESYSTVILNDQPNREQIQQLNTYLNNSGSILEFPDLKVYFQKSQVSKSTSQTLINKTVQQAFKHIPYVDVSGNIQLHKDSELFEGLIHFQNHEEGSLAFFGIDVSSQVQKTGYTRKRFYSTAGDYPDEIVSKVSKHELLELLSSTLRELHYRQGLPFISKWTSPSEKQVFGFRIDSDFGDQQSVDDLYYVLKKHSISGTWFLHVEAHQEWLEHFHDFEDQEIALHGYQHGTSNSESKVRSNIETGKEYLKSAGLNFDGFCAPYGIWNKALASSLTESSFSYSTEFTFAYEGFPIQPIGEALPLQIPIHPICTGSLNRRKYSIDSMKEYFEQVLEKKAGRFEPIFFYHHPLQHGLEVIDSILEEINKLNLKNMTFSDFATFWKSREALNCETFFDGNQIQIQSTSDTKKLIKISSNHDSFDLVESKNGQIELKETSKFSYSNSYLPEPKQVQELKTQDLRLLKTSLWDWKNRIRL